MPRIETRFRPSTVAASVAPTAAHSPDRRAPNRAEERNNSADDENADGAAEREGIERLHSNHGLVEARGHGNAFILRAIDPESGDLLVAVRETSPDRAGLMSAMSRAEKRFERWLQEALDR